MIIEWKGEPHPELDDRVRKEVDGLLADGLGCTDDLITHLIEIGDLDTGPLIGVYGSGGKVHAEYIKDPKWVSMDGTERTDTGVQSLHPQEPK